eukprot:273017-Prorocentrum_lima.AAC.1
MIASNSRLDGVVGMHHTRCVPCGNRLSKMDYQNKPAPKWICSARTGFSKCRPHCPAFPACE